MIEELLSRLDAYGLKRGAGRNSWTCKCPAHDDRLPSLSITYEMDGRILLHCFAGCEVDNIVGAIGLSLSDLMPPKEERDSYKAPPTQVRVPASDLLRVLHYEATLVWVAAHNLAQGIELDEGDRKRLSLACQRINFAMERAGLQK